MEERIDNETVQQIDLISMLKDIGREWLTILLLAIAAALFADIWICATYQPEYRTSTTFVVTAKGMNNNIYQNLNSTKELAELRLFAEQRVQLLLSVRFHLLVLISPSLLHRTQSVLSVASGLWISHSLIQDIILQ